jgi:hypothetical protein
MLPMWNGSVLLLHEPTGSWMLVSGCIRTMRCGNMERCDEDGDVDGLCPIDC